jgi:septal ring factor EnvC (AmiA/AmiB activator)
MPWPKRSPAAVQLKQHNAALALHLLRLREQLTNKEHCASGLEVLLRERLARIDELSATIDRLRDQNKKLNQENEHLAAMLKHERADRLMLAKRSEDLGPLVTLLAKKHA